MASVKTQKKGEVPRPINEDAKPAATQRGMRFGSPAFIAADGLSIDLAIGTVILVIAITLTWVLNYVIYKTYTPDIEAILDKVTPGNVNPRNWFKPEPVERLQYQVTLLAFPVIIYLTYSLLSRGRALFEARPRLPLFINIAAPVMFVVYFVSLLPEDLKAIPGETTALFFKNNLASMYGPWLMLPLYLGIGWMVMAYYRRERAVGAVKAVRIACFALVAVMLGCLLLYNIFNLAEVAETDSVEANVVFYSITQVLAGKSLLVNINAQYGLYAWFLQPVFRVIGLSPYKIGIVLAVLNCASFLFLYLGIRKLVKKELFAVMVFLCLVFWNYWQSRVPFDQPERHYYQYWPLRILFPALAFYLVTIFHERAGKGRWLLPLLALTGGVAVLWNLDSGVVTFGALLGALVFSTLRLPVRAALRQSAVYAAWMVGGLAVVLLIFFMSTRMHAGAWPELGKFAAYQKMFYISGFLMLAMKAFHFWNLPALIYFVACIYCSAHARKQSADTPVVAFLVLLGAGLFSYFQGRSYDLTVDIVMYPAIILLGVFGVKLMDQLNERRLWLHQATAIFAIVFICLADGALSMVYHLPSVISNSAAVANAYDPMKEQFLKQRMEFIRSNLHQKDTVIILSRNYDSYFYTAGGYYNPMNLPGSTEIMLGAETDSVVQCIATTRYPIIYDALRPWYAWYVKDTFVQALAQYTTLQKTSPDRTLLLLKPGKVQAPGMLVPGPGTVYYNRLGEFNKYARHAPVISLRENFTVEFVAIPDPARLAKENLMLGNVSDKVPHVGMFIQQAGDDLTQYKFSYGDGRRWCDGASFRLGPGENHVVIRVQRNMISVFNNGVPCAEVNTGSVIRNSDGEVFVDDAFAGKISELKIDNQ